MEVATLFSFCFTVTFQVTSQNLLTRNGIGLPNLTDYKNASNDHRIGIHYQAIVPTYKFSCCGKITEWGLDVFDNGSFTLDLQVWRPSSTVNDSTGTDCYSLVGNNRFTSVSVSGGLAVVTPSPQDYIQFRSGDVLGFYVEDATHSHYPNPGVVILASPSWFISESVWLASIAGTAKTSQNGDCPYSVGSSGVLNTLSRAAPVISISITSVPCSPSPTISSPTSVESIFTTVHTPSTNMLLFSSSSMIMIESTLSTDSENITVSSQYDVSSVVPSISKPTTTKTTIVKSLMLENKTTLIISVVIPTLFMSLIIIITSAIIILWRNGKKSEKRKQREPGECVSQQGISNQAYFESESQLQTNEAGIEIVPASNGQSVIYHCIGPSTSAGKTVSDSEQPETHHYFELEALPTHHVYQYADIDQLSSGRAKDKAAANSGKSVPVYEDMCSQKFQDPKGCESESKDVNTETGVHTNNENS